MSETKYIFEVIERAGVTMSAFAKLTGISRESLYRWRNGSPVTDKLRLNLATTYAKHLETATTKGDLPLKGVSPKERNQVLRKVISQVMRKK